MSCQKGFATAHTGVKQGADLDGGVAADQVVRVQTAGLTCVPITENVQRNVRRAEGAKHLIVTCVAGKIRLRCMRCTKIRGTQQLNGRYKQKAWHHRFAVYRVVRRGGLELEEAVA